MAQTVAKACKHCPQCQFAKADTNAVSSDATKTDLGPVASIDLIGPFPRGEGGHLYVLTMVDVHSCYVVVARYFNDSWSTLTSKSRPPM